MHDPTPMPRRLPADRPVQARTRCHTAPRGVSSRMDKADKGPARMPVLIEIAPFAALSWIITGAILVWLSGPRGWRCDVPLVILWPFHVLYEVFRK